MTDPPLQATYIPSCNHILGTWQLACIYLHLPAVMWSRFSAVFQHLQYFQFPAKTAHWRKLTFFNDCHVQLLSQKFHKIGCDHLVTHLMTTMTCNHNCALDSHVEDLYLKEDTTYIYSEAM